MLITDVFQRALLVQENRLFMQWMTIDDAMLMVYAAFRTPCRIDMNRSLPSLWYKRNKDQQTVIFPSETRGHLMYIVTQMLDQASVKLIVNG